jgi:integrase
VYPQISLKEAREKREQAKKLLADGIDPSQEKKLDKLKRHVSAENSLEAVAREWHEKRRGQWQAHYAKQVMQRLENDIFPTIGFRAIDEIKPIELLAVLRKVEARKAYDLTHRLLSILSQIYRYAVSTCRAERDITYDLRGALKRHKKEHHPSLKESEVKGFLEKLDAFDCHVLTKLALKLMMLTFVRSIEMRGARWEEFDFNKAVWQIPAERMKMKEKHIVPLSQQALMMLNELKRLSGRNAYLFPNHHNPENFMSNNTLSKALRSMEYEGKTTPHGFRALASTILNENGFNKDWVERQLAHTERDEVRASYNYAQYLPERTNMMQWWADYLEEKGLQHEKRIQRTK